MPESTPIARLEDNHPQEDSLVQKMLSAISRRCRSVFRGGPDSDDVVQNILLKIFLLRQAGKDPIEIERMIPTITQNAIFDEFRRKKARRTDCTDALNESHLASDSLIPKIELLDLYQRIDRLPELECCVLRLRLIDGLSFKEISDKLGYSPQKVKTAVDRGYRRLRNDLLASAGKWRKEA